MTTSAKELPCDGCGRPASPEHIAGRIRRLELSTMFRPIHIGVLFVAYAPPIHQGNVAPGTAQLSESADPFLSDLVILATEGPSALPPTDAVADSARLAEFQHRGYYLAYLSECPIGAQEESVESAIARLAPTLIRRIRFNYKPKQIAPLGPELAALIPALRAAGIGPILTLDDGQPLPDPRSRSREWRELFQRAVAATAPRETHSAGCDTIRLTSTG
jgi:hypothetical protein